MGSPQTVRGARGGESAATLDMCSCVLEIALGKKMGAKADVPPIPRTATSAGMLNFAMVMDGMTKDGADDNYYI